MENPPKVSSERPEPINTASSSSHDETRSGSHESHDHHHKAVVHRLQSLRSSDGKAQCISEVLDPKERSIHGGVSFQMHDDHWMCTFATDSTGYKKMLRYDIEKLVKIGGLASMFCSGTVFTMDNQLLKSVSIYIIGMCVVAILMIATMEKDVLAEFDTQAMESLTGFINGFVPFVLALYVSLVIQRWWSLRTQALGAIFNAVSNTTLIVASSLPGENWAKLRSEIVRLGMASIMLVVNAAHENYDLTPLVTQGLLDEEEKTVLQEAELFQRASMMWVWILRICADGFDAAKLPPPRYNTIMTKAIQARDGIQTIHTYLDTQLPFAYVHLITLLVNLQNLVFAVKCGVVSAVAYSTGETQQIVVQIVMCALVIVIYQGLLICSYIIHDPFGEDLLDFPIIAYTEYLSWTCAALQRGSSHCPALRPDKRAELLGQGSPLDAGSTAKGKAKDEQKGTKPEPPPAPTPAPRKEKAEKKKRNKHSVPHEIDAKVVYDHIEDNSLRAAQVKIEDGHDQGSEAVAQGSRIGACFPRSQQITTMSRPCSHEAELKEDGLTTAIKSLDAEGLTTAIKSLASELRAFRLDVYEDDDEDEEGDENPGAGGLF